MYVCMQAALKLKQKMFKEDWEFFKAQRRLLEQTLPKHRQTSSQCHSRYSASFYYVVLLGCGYSAAVYVRYSTVLQLRSPWVIVVSQFCRLFGSFITLAVISSKLHVQFSWNLAESETSLSLSLLLFLLFFLLLLLLLLLWLLLMYWCWLLTSCRCYSK